MKSIARLLERFFFIFEERKIVVAGIVLAFLISAGLDVTAIGAMGMFISLLIDNNHAIENVLPLQIINDIFSPSVEKLTILFGVLCLLFFAIKSVCNYLIQLFILRFNSLKRATLQRNMFHNYLYASYTVHLNRNFAEITHRTSYMTTLFTQFANDLIQLTGNVLLCVILTVFLAITNFGGTLSICLIFGTFGAIYYFLIKDKSYTYGIRANEARQSNNLTIKNAMFSVEESRILGCENYFEELVKDAQKKIVHNEVLSFALNLIPRPFAEFLLIAFIVVFTLTYFIINGNIAEVSTSLGVFALAGLRIVPAVSSIAASLQGLKSKSFCVHLLFEEINKITEVKRDETAKANELAQSKSTNEDILRFNESIEIKDLNFRYPKTNHNVIDNLQITIEKGNAIALIGRSGAGKSTLLRLLLGHLIPNSGSISVDGKSIHNNLNSWRKLICYLPQTIYILGDSLARNVAFGVPDKDIDLNRVNWALKEALLQELVDSLPNGIETNVGDQGSRISGGQCQRIGIARALYHHREVLIMDEATSALDEETEAQIKETILRMKGKLTIVMITHHLRDTKVFDEIYKIEKGKIINNITPST